jgi:hypothetical protein
VSELGQGLLLSGIGILITFSALGILILLIVVLKALFPHRKIISEGSHPITDPPAGTDQDREKIRQQAAAAGVAVLLSKRKNSRKGNLGKELEKPMGPWWQIGLNRIHGKEKL